VAGGRGKAGCRRLVGRLDARCHASGLPAPRRRTFAPGRRGTLRGCPHPVAGRSLRAVVARFGAARTPSPDVRSGHPCPPLTPRRLRFRPPGCACRRGRLPGYGQPLARLRLGGDGWRCASRNSHPPQGCGGAHSGDEGHGWLHPREVSAFPRRSYRGRRGSS